MQVWCMENERCYKVFINPPKSKIEALRVDMLYYPERKYYVTYLDNTCNDNEIITMLQQEKYRKAPWFEEV